MGHRNSNFPTDHPVLYQLHLVLDVILNSLNCRTRNMSLLAEASDIASRWLGSLGDIRLGALPTESNLRLSMTWYIASDDPQILIPSASPLFLR